MKDGFNTLINNPDLAYFDSAASTQTHQQVVDRIKQYYEKERCIFKFASSFFEFNFKRSNTAYVFLFSFYLVHIGNVFLSI